VTRLGPAIANELRFTRVFGAAGIGTGIFFRLDGSQTMSRNESRLGELLPWRDYCKMHIILHYLSVLLGSGGSSGFRAFPVGRVGDDEAGGTLLEEMRAAGMDLSGVAVDRGSRTLFSVCFQYPDSSGGNITSSNGASGRMTAHDVDEFFVSAPEPRGWELMVAVPEAPLAARMALLEQGRRRGAFNAASVLAQEAPEFMDLGGAAKVDLIAVNTDEAARIAGMDGGEAAARDVATACHERLCLQNPGISSLVTHGSGGCFACSGGIVRQVPALKAEAISTAGAGDALLAGTLAGLACGLSLVKDHEDASFSQTPLSSAVELGTLLASFSVTSPDTIHLGANATELRKWAARAGAKLSEGFSRMLRESD
jgi:sugar/nucleoside kinase (ribokinase family)